MTLRFLFLILGLFLAGGCAQWDKVETRSPVQFQFPKRRIAIDAVGLEIGLAQLDVSQQELLEQFWNSLDQQKLSLPTRQRLDQNGLRVALMPSHAPSILNQLLEPRPVELEKLNLVETQLAAAGRLDPKTRMVTHERISNREGQAYPVQTADVHSQFKWVVQNGDRQTVGAGESVRAVFDVTTFPQSDSTVRLKFTPTVHHGKVRPTIGVTEGAFFYDSTQTTNKFSDLAFSITVRPGETVVVAPTSDVADLGKLFFGVPDNLLDVHPNHTHRILMIRVVQTQTDDLFGGTSTHDRLTTTSPD